MEDLALWTTSLVLVGTSAFLFGMLVRSIVQERRRSRVRRLRRNFGLSLTFPILFLVSWAAQGIAEWSSFAHEQAAHGQVAHRRTSGWSSGSRRWRTGNRSSCNCSRSS
jgi:hypothetical protein